MKWVSFLIFFFCFQINLIAQKQDQIIQSYRNGEFQKAIDLGKQYLDSDSLNMQVGLTVGRAFAELEEYSNAIYYLEKSRTENEVPWIKAWSLAYLGMCRYLTDQPDSAKKNLEECILLKATSNSTRYAEKRLIRYQMIEFFDDWEVTETEHFRFHFQDKKKVSVSEFINERENAYQKINEFFHASLPKKIDFYVWNNAEDALRILDKPLGYSDVGICLINAEKNQTRGHEITHVLTEYGFHPVKKTKLINEGLAVYFDQSNRNRMEIAKQSFKGDSLNLVDLWNNPQNYPNDDFYTIGGAFIEFLMKKSATQILFLIKNQTVEVARAAYPEFDQMIREFQVGFLKK